MDVLDYDGFDRAKIILHDDVRCQEGVDSFDSQIKIKIADYQISRKGLIMTIFDNLIHFRYRVKCEIFFNFCKFGKVKDQKSEARNESKGITEGLIKRY